MSSPNALETWMESTATSSLLVRVEDVTVVEINRPLAADGYYGIDGLPHEGSADDVLGLPYEVLPDGRMRQDLASAQKSVVAVLGAIGVDQGFVSFDDPVSKHLGAGWSRAEPDQEGAVTLRHLMSMTSGLSDGLTYEVPAGERWRYSLGPAWHLLKPVLRSATGMTLEELTWRWLAEPVGMADSTWLDRPGMAYLDGTPFEALMSSARDLGHFGQMVLDRGTAGGQRVVSEESLSELLAPSQTINPAYGLLWWLNGQRPHLQPLNDEPIDETLLPSAPSDTVAAMGALGQLCLVSRSRQTVIVRLGTTPPGTGMATGGSTADDVWKVVEQVLF